MFLHVLSQHCNISTFWIQFIMFSGSQLSNQWTISWKTIWISSIEPIQCSSMFWFSHNWICALDWLIGLSQSNAALCFDFPMSESVQIVLQHIVDWVKTAWDYTFTEAALQTEFEVVFRAVLKEQLVTCVWRTEMCVQGQNSWCYIFIP